MFAFYIDSGEVKTFMHRLFKTEAFDVFEVRSLNLTTIANFYIEGTLNRDFFEEPPDRLYCTWQELRPMVFDLVKGTKTPKQMKLVFSQPKAKLMEIHPNCGSAFLNIIFEKGIVTFTTGSSQKNFSTDKAPEDLWNAYIEGFFKSLGIAANKII